MPRLTRLAVLAVSALALTGCMFFETPADRKMQHMPNYRAGYSDGCATANNEGADMRHGDVLRDGGLYETDKAYRIGWAEGHSACRRMAPTGQERGPLPDVNPGGGH